MAIIKENLILFSSDSLYNEHINEVSPESLVFVSKNGAEKLITQNKTYYFVPGKGRVGQVLKQYDGYIGWETLTTASEGYNVTNLSPKPSNIILRVSATTEDNETALKFTNDFEQGQTTTVYLTKAASSEYDPVVVLNEEDFESINGQRKLVLKDNVWVSVKFFRGVSRTVFAEVNDVNAKLEEMLNNDFVTFLPGYSDRGEYVEGAVMMNETNRTKNLYELSIGRFNDSIRATAGTFAPDKMSEGKYNSLFTVGNGENDGNRHDAFRVGQDGDVQIVDIHESGKKYYEKRLFVLQDKLKEYEAKFAEYDARIAEINSTVNVLKESFYKPITPQIIYTSSSKIDDKKLNLGDKMISHEFEDGTGVITLDIFTTEIPDNFIGWNMSLKSIEFKDCHNIISIGDNFLEYNEALVSADLSNLTSLTTIGSNFLTSEQYEDCSLKTLILPDNITSIGDNFLTGCTAMTSIDLSNLSKLSGIGDHFLGDCYGLTEVILPTITSELVIGDRFMYGCRSLGSIDLSPLKNIISVGKSFLSGCKSLTSINLRPLNKVTFISGSFLAGCTGLTEIDLASLSEGSKVGDSFLSGCTSLESIDLSPLSQVKSIGDYFLSETSLSAIDLSPLKSTATVGIYFLSDNKELTEVDLSVMTALKNIDNIGDYMLDGCTSLTKVTVPCDMEESYKEKFEKLSEIIECN